MPTTSHPSPAKLDISGLDNFFENSANQNCEGGEFSCLSSSQCIPWRWTCDRDEDCPDGSDESSSVCSERACSLDEWTCHGAGPSQCLPVTWVCDNHPDCDDGSDEAVCTRTCLSMEFTCRSGRCVQAGWLCDGEDDCGDGSDEEGCPVQACARGEVRCHAGTCVKNRHVCDGDVGEYFHNPSSL